MLEEIRRIGVVVFVLSAPIAFIIGMFNTYHPEAQKKMQDFCERHNKIFISVMLVYVLLSLTGISQVIASIC